MVKALLGSCIDDSAAYERYRQTIIPPHPPGRRHAESRVLIDGPLVGLEAQKRLVGDEEIPQLPARLGVRIVSYAIMTRHQTLLNEIGSGERGARRQCGYQNS